MKSYLKIYENGNVCIEDAWEVYSGLSFAPSNYTRRRIPKPYADYRC